MKLRDWFELVRIQLQREEGQTMAEYGLLLAFIAIIVLVGVQALGGNILGVFTSVSTSLTS